MGHSKDPTDWSDSQPSEFIIELYPNGDLLLSREIYKGKNSANLWQLSNGKKLAEFVHPNLQSIVVSSDEGVVATVSSNSIRLWDLKPFQMEPND